jgi:uncharacterized RDD family membrane protein YckC
MDYSNNTDESLRQFLFKKASVRRRLGAFLIDHTIFSFVFVFVFSLLSKQDNEFLLLLSIISALVITFFVYGFRDIISGQSIGKRVLGIGVRDISDNFTVPPASRLFLRQIFTFMWPIEFLVLVFSSKNRKIGDKIAGTGVYNLREYEEFIHYAKRMGYISQVQSTELQNTGSIEPRNIEPYKPKKAKAIMIIAGMLLAGIIFFSALVFGITSIFKNHPSYHVATDHIRTNPEIIAIIGEVEGFGFMPSGGFSVSPGRGDANYAISVRGTHGNIRVFVELQKRDGGDWKIVKLNFVQR